MSNQSLNQAFKNINKICNAPRVNAPTNETFNYYCMQIKNKDVKEKAPSQSPIRSLHKLSKWEEWNALSGLPLDQSKIIYMKLVHKYFI